MPRFFRYLYRVPLLLVHALIGLPIVPGLVERLTLASAELVNEAFLRQSAFSEADRYCAPELDDKVFVRCRAVHRGTSPLLAGPVPVISPTRQFSR